MKALDFADQYSDAIEEGQRDGEEITIGTNVQVLVDGKMAFITGISIGHDEDSGEPVMIIEGSSNPGY